MKYPSFSVETHILTGVFSCLCGVCSLLRPFSYIRKNGCFGNCWELEENQARQICKEKRGNRTRKRATLSRQCTTGGADPEQREQFRNNKRTIFVHDLNNRTGHEQQNTPVYISRNMGGWGSRRSPGGDPYTSSADLHTGNFLSPFYSLLVNISALFLRRSANPPQKSSIIFYSLGVNTPAGPGGSSGTEWDPVAPVK